MLQLLPLLHLNFDNATDTIATLKYSKSPLSLPSGFGFEELLIGFGIDSDVYGGGCCNTFDQFCYFFLRLCYCVPMISFLMSDLFININQIFRLNLHMIVIIQYFYYSQYPMQNKKKQSHLVHLLTEKTSMRFIPKNFTKPSPKPKKESQPKKSASVISRFSLTSFWNRNSAPIEKSSSQTEVASEPNIQSQINIMQEVKEVVNQQVQQVQRPINYKLKFAVKVSSEHILIGNQLQLDLIFFLGINANNYVQTEYYWSLIFKDPIQHVSVDKKKLNLLAIVSGKTLYVYKFDSKKFTQNNPIIPFKQVILVQNPKFIQVVKDGNICLFYADKAEVYLVGDDIRRRYNKPYQKPDVAKGQNSKYQLFLVPDPLDNILNVFYEQKNLQNQKVFTLWCVQMEFLASEIKVSTPQKVYDIKTGLRSTLSIRNYSKQIFLINLGSQILALKKGYILDSATVNLKHEQSLLEYIGNEQILHISKKKIQIYSFIINTHVKPNKIILKAKDSIKIRSNQDSADEYFKVLQILTDDLIFIFQRSSEQVRSKSGQIHYSFYITRAITRQNKMNQLFPKIPNQQFKIDDPILIDKCDMAQKMGFTTREIYLQLWSRSHQSRKQDYKILVATKDYNTIKQEIVRKLKKASMNFKQIRDIQEACFYMLQERVFSSSCTDDAVMDYLSSHFFKRKLEMFKDLQFMQKYEKERQTGKQQNEVFKMTIRQYQQYKSMSIKTELISLINQFCHQDKIGLSKNIRLLLRTFKFVFRTIYYDLLEQIIVTAKNKLLNLLKEIPQLLPYNPPEHETTLHIPRGFYDGVWTQITKQQQTTSLFVDAITTIDNKQIIDRVTKSINFRRNYLSQHDMVIESRQKIKDNYQKIKSPLTFYFFAAKIFKLITDEAILENIVKFLQLTYELPNNLIGNMFLINKLYNFFIERGIAPQVDGKTIDLSEFFSYQDKQLIRHCFDKQRSNKGLLLKDIKNIFKQILKQQANSKYNTALLNYFTSDLSQVSDLKYILNRINNQKVQFHQENQQMYQILVQALERKLKIGTDNDIPIEQVLIYIQNIPLKFNSSPSKSLQELKAVQKIEKESEFLRQAKVDMSIYDILHNHQKVFNKLIEHIINTSQPHIWTSNDPKVFLQEFAIKKLALLEAFDEEIYEQVHNKMIFFLFLTKICERTQRITFADILLKNKDLQQRMDQDTAEVLVLFMKKWKLSLQKQYMKNQQYILQLLKLLPQESNIRVYIQCQLQFAKVLSAPQCPVTYPISQSYINSSDVREIIFDLPTEFVMEIDVPHLYNILQRMQQIISLDNQQQDFTITSRITMHQIYEYVIIKLINFNKLRQVLPIIRKILTLEVSETTYNIIYMMLFIIQISPQFNETNKNNLIQCMSYYFYQPIVLLEMMEYLMNNRLNGHQVKKFLEDNLDEGKKKHKSFNQFNPVFSEQIVSNIKSKQDENNFTIMLQKTTKYLQQAKQQFKNIKYSIVMISLCNSPYLLAKFISCSFNYDPNIRSLRSFLSYAIKQTVFKPFCILELGRRIFFILLQAAKSKQPIQSVIQRYQDISLENDIDFQGYQPPKDKNSYQYIMWKSAQAFKKKKMAYEQQNKNKNILSPPPSQQQQNSQVQRSSFGQIVDAEERQPSQYPFTEIDSDNQERQQIFQKPKNKKRQKQVAKFDASQEMKNLLQFDSTNKTNKLFLSTRAQPNSSKTNNNLSVSIRQPHRSAPNNALHFSRDQKIKPKYSQQKLLFDQVGQLNQSQDFNENEHLDCKTDRQNKLRPSHSGISSDPRRSADSSPQILLNRFDQKAMMQDQHLTLQNLTNKPLQKSIHEPDQKLQQSISNVYAIQVKQAYDPQQLAEMNKKIPQNINLNEPQIMAESTQLGNPVTEIVVKLVQINKQALQNPLADFDLSPLAPYSNSQPMLTSVIKNLYRDYADFPNLNKIMKLIGSIVNYYHDCEINPDIFNTLVKAQQVQSKTIPQIPFSGLISELTICYPYESKRHLFEQLYKNLKKHIDSQNIYKITQFIRRVFDDNSDYEQQVTWDFILQLCDKLQYCQEQDKTWSVEKIQATLSKVQVRIWSAKIQNFRDKVLQSQCKELLLQVFCNYLSYKKGDGQAIIFLQNLIELDDSPIIKQTLKAIQ